MAEPQDHSFNDLLLEIFRDALNPTGDALESMDLQQIQLAKSALLRINHKILLQEQRLLADQKSSQPAFSFSLTATTSLNQESNAVDLLNDREKEILMLISEGLSNKAISETLNLKLSTIKWYSTNIFEKLSVENRTQAANRARELKLIP